MGQLISYYTFDEQTGMKNEEAMDLSVIELLRLFDGTLSNSKFAEDKFALIIIYTI